jgi:phenylalanyl-tRNA synthetase beta chain
MFELGRPSHIFDLDKINQGLVVRWAKPGETLKLLNGNMVTLDEKVGVIADASQVESLAGIMGGDATAVSDDTQNIYIKSFQFIICTPFQICFSCCIKNN